MVDPLENVYGNWNKYLWSREQLASYISAFTGEGDITVIESGGGAATHLREKVVRLPIGADHVADTAAHEATHIKHTDNMAMHALRGDPASVLVLNALEDARMEREEWKQKPGLKAQWQATLDSHMPVILEEDWLTQSIKGILIECAGYDYPRAEFRPKSRKHLLKFDASGLKWKVRNAQSTMDLVPIVPLVLALFDEAPKPPKQPSTPTQTEPDAPPPEPSPFGNHGDPQPGPSDGEGEPGEGEPQPSMGSDPGDSSEPDTGEGECDGSLNCAHCDAIEEAEAKRGNAAPPSRPAQEYDADDAKAAADIARKTGQDGKPQGGQAESVDGYDKVTGGPTTNRLLERAKSLAKKLERLDRETTNQKTDTGPANVPLGGKPATSGPKDSPDIDPEAPDATKPYGDFDKMLKDGPGQTDRYGRKMHPWDEVLPALSSGSLGYRGVAANVHDSRRMEVPGVYGTTNLQRVRDRALEAEVQTAATGNYLGRQMRIWLQSQDRSAMRDHERFGLFDPRRSYAMGAGRFDVYKNPPKFKPSKPLVSISVDMSSSMMAYGRRNNRERIYNFTPDGSSYHAVIATWLMARALSQINVPFEVIGFGGGSDLYMMKTFDRPYDDNAKAALVNIATQASGGTPAAEGLALSWVRALTRPEKRKVIIQVTDCAVAENTRDVAKNIRDQGGTVIGVGIGADDKRTRSYYGDGFAVSKASELPPRFLALLRRLALEGKLR